MPDKFAYLTEKINRDLANNAKYPTKGAAVEELAQKLHLPDLQAISSSYNKLTAQEEDTELAKMKSI